jgi:hypothetical protein
MRRLGWLGSPLAVALVAGAFASVAPRTAQAKEEMILKQADQHPDYVAELDVHGVFAYGPTVGRYDVIGFGPGLHANFRLLKNGFIPDLNNNIALGVGAALVFDANYGDVRLVTPVVLQWNFWVSTHWSVFGEPGIAIEFPMSTPRGPEPVYLSPSLSVGGRYNFNDHVALVIRIGFPVTTVGVSFFL